jgi:hypothetical protein
MSRDTTYHPFICNKMRLIHKILLRVREFILLTRDIGCYHIKEEKSIGFIGRLGGGSLYQFGDLFEMGVVGGPEQFK